tara:strand:+ start:25625 stop:26149 length:525 start_codon:yes stop_codon:yes gene_type:complete
MYILISIILNALYGYEAINLLLRVAPSRGIIRILRYYGATIGNGVRISSPLTIHNASQSKNLFSNLTLGNECYVGRDCIIDLMGKVKIGNNVTISHRAILNTHTNAGKSPVAKKRLKNTVGTISINDGSYLGLNVTVLESVSIGKNCIVGAKSLVNNDLPKNSIAYGIPCKVKG